MIWCGLAQKLVGTMFSLVAPLSNMWSTAVLHEALPPKCGWHSAESEYTSKDIYFNLLERRLCADIAPQLLCAFAADPARTQPAVKEGTWT